MHCPQCGQQPPTEQTRYCTHCGFALGTLREFLSAGTVPGSVRQRDITLGAGLMLVGTIKSLIGAMFLGGSSFGGSLFLLAAFFSLLQLFFQLSPRQKGLSLGASLLFMSSLAALLAGSVTEGAGALLVAGFAIPVILFWQRLSAGFLKLFFDKAESGGHQMIPVSKPIVALPAAQAPADLDTDRMKPVAVFEPASIIEGTTKTLREKQPSGAL